MLCSVASHTQTAGSMGPSALDVASTVDEPLVTSDAYASRLYSFDDPVKQLSNFCTKCQSYDK